MKATVTRIFIFNDKQIKEFMEWRGYEGEDSEYTAEDVENELDNAEASELEEFCDCNCIYDYDVDVEE